MIQATHVRAIPDILERLKKAPADRQYLSVHLDSSPGQTFGHAYKTWYRDAIRDLRTQVANADDSEKARFEHAVGVADAFVHDHAAPETAGLVVYADGTGEIEITVPLPMAPRNHVVWASYLDLEPLIDALDEQERMAVVVLDKERTRLFTIFLGEIEEQDDFVDEVVGRQATGDWFGLSQKRYERHHDYEVMLHVKRTIRALMDELRKRPFDRLLLGGSPEAVTTLTHRLPPPLRNRLAGTLNIELFVTDAEIVDAALRAADLAERRYELDEVRRILDASTGQHAAVGAEATLAVIDEARVHRLFVARDLELAGGECPGCGRLVMQGERCPVCGQDLFPIPSIRPRAIAHALAQGARVEIVAGEAADLLMEHGGMAAWTRY